MCGRIDVISSKIFRVGHLFIWAPHTETIALDTGKVYSKLFRDIKSYLIYTYNNFYSYLPGSSQMAMKSLWQRIDQKFRYLIYSCKLT